MSDGPKTYRSPGGSFGAFIPALLFATMSLCFVASNWAGEVIPQRPVAHFNDFAGVCSREKVEYYDRALRGYEQSTSITMLCVVYPTMQSDSDIADYCTRVFEKWKIGAKGKDTGVVLFVFVNDHRMRIVTGYGLEGNLPDAVCRRITDETIAPLFKAGKYEQGLGDGLNAIMVAINAPDKPAPAPPPPPKRTIGGALCSITVILGLLAMCLLVVRYVGGIFLAVVANLTLWIFFHGQTKPVSRFGRMLAWIETHGYLNSGTTYSGAASSGSYRAGHASGYRYAGASSHSSRPGLSYTPGLFAGAFAILGGLGAAGEILDIASGGSTGGGGASGRW